MRKKPLCLVSNRVALVCYFSGLEIYGRNMESGDDEDEEAWWRPPWEDDEASEPPGGPPQRRKPPVEPDYAHLLLGPLARAQDGLARLEARTEAASAAVAEGLRARMAYREAAGWLTHAHVWIHPWDLALRDLGLTGSYGAAARANRLEAELPATVAQGSSFDGAPSDLIVGQALRLARLWRRLAEFRTWAPLADAAAMRETLRSLGAGGAVRDAEIEDWLALVHMREQGPALIQADRGARDWMNRPQVTEAVGADGIFLAACLWRQSGFGRAISLPFWSAPERRHHRLGLRVGVEWMAGFLDCVADAARAGRDELARLQQAEDKARPLARTARSRLPAAIEAVLRVPVVNRSGPRHKPRRDPTGSAWLAAAAPRGRDDPRSDRPRLVAGLRRRMIGGENSGIPERGNSGTREFYLLIPRFSSQASRASNRSSLSLRSALAARWRKRLRNAGDTLNARA